MGMTKPTKLSIFFLLIFTLFLSAFAFSLSPSDPNTVYITSGDVIKNFRLDSFDDSEIDAGYTTDKYGNKLVFGSSAYWEIQPDTIELQYFLQDGDLVYFKYDVIATNQINIYTNCKADDTTESLSPITEDFRVATYTHLAMDGQTRFSWYGDLHWNHYDFYPTSDIRTYNAENNYFAGDLVMSFDIDTTPIPTSVVDAYGNIATKEFSHISVVSLYTTEELHGFLSDETPIITGTTPDKYDPFAFNSDSNSVVDTSQIDQIISYTFDPDTRLFAPYLADSFDYAITPQPEHTSLNPTTKLGTALWDPKTENKSATDCEFTYHITSLSPVVKQYNQQIAFTPKTVIAQDVWTPTLFDWLHMDIVLNEQVSTRQTQTRNVAQQVSNRYIQAGLSAKFSVWSAYTIEALVDSNNITLGLPAEYFDYLAWSSAVDGFGGAVGESQLPIWFDSASTITIVIILLAVVGIGGYILYRRFRKGKNKIPSVNINIKR